MILVDTFDSDEEVKFLIEKLKKCGIEYTEQNNDSGKQVYINEKDVIKLNGLINSLD